MKPATRLCIYPKDVQRITGKSERFGRVLIRKIKNHLNKTSDQFVTIEEFSAYTGISLDAVSSFLN